MANISEELGGRSTPISQPQQESKGTGNDLALDQHFETGSPGAEKADPKKIDGHDAQEAEAARQVRGIKWALIIGSVLTSTFLFGLDNTITANIQPTIVTNFNSVAKLPWLSVAFMACAGSTTLFWYDFRATQRFLANVIPRGAMYGQCNIKWLYITCITVFEVGSALCGAAPTMNALIVGRAICGFGGTGMYTGVLYVTRSVWLRFEFLITEAIQNPSFGIDCRTRTCDILWPNRTRLGNRHSSWSYHWWCVYLECSDLAMVFLHQPCRGGRMCSSLSISYSVNHIQTQGKPQRTSG